VPGAFSDDPDPSVVADGELSCRDLQAHDSARQVASSLAARGLSTFEAYVVAEFSTEYFCPQYSAQALTDVQQTLLGDS
jgi:hypothetical protein